MIHVEVRLFNSLTKYGNGKPGFRIALPEGSTVGDVLRRLDVPQHEIFLVLHNGRNLMRGFGFNSGIETGHGLSGGDVVALSGPVPFSRGYGAPVV